MDHHRHSRRTGPRGAALVLLLSAGFAAAAAPANQEVETLAVVDSLCQVVTEHYFDEEVALQTANHVAERFVNEAYAGLDAAGLASALTEDVRALTKDLHYRISYEPERFAFLSEHGSGEEQVPEDVRRREAIAGNFGFKHLEILPGNVGYLKLDEFSGEPGVMEKAHAAMAFLGDCQAILLDLRDNGGGHSDVEQLVISYFFPAEPARHLTTFRYRDPAKNEEVWTLTDELPSKRMPDTPLWILTSPRTFSAAEAAAYQLSVRGRATIVGRRSSGGANPVNFFALADGFIAKVPIAEGIDAETGTSWEGAGVPVDVECPEEEARDRAHLLALEHRLETCSDRERTDLAWALDLRRAILDPVPIEEPRLQSYSGAYAGQRVAVRGGELWFSRSRSGEDWMKLHALSANTFMLAETTDFRVTFECGVPGQEDRALVTFRDGKQRFFLRTP